MSFKPRNSFYLRISATTVLQLLLYLDARHVDFMTADILERVLSALKPRIVQKLGAELGNTKNKKRREADSEKVDVFRGAGWQMAYFFRKTTHKHAVLLKDKQITFEPIPNAESVAPAANGNGRSRKKRKVHVLEDEDEEEQDLGEGTSQASRLQANTSAQVEATDLTHLEGAQDTEALPLEPQVKEEQQDDDLQLLQGSDGFPGFPILGQEDDEDVKPEGKPTLRVSYNGFSIFGRTLIVIVEPYMAPGNSRASVAPSEREPSEAPSARETPGPSDERSRSRSTSALPVKRNGRPLFRPETPIDEDDEELPDLPTGEAGEEELERFRMRSQSIFSVANYRDDDAVEQGQFARPK